MGSNNDVLQVMGKNQAFGPTTAAYGITVFAGLNAMAIKIVSGGGTFEIGSSAGSAQGSGYPLGSNEIFTMDQRGTLWCMVTGATMIMGIVQGKTAGT